MSDQPLSMSMFASSADYWNAMYKASRAEVDGLRADFATGTDALGAEIERLRAKVKELALQALSDSGQAIENLEDATRYRWLRARLPGSAYRIAGVIYSEGGAGVDAAIDAARAADAAIR